jgi:pyrroline-5-carboxylate reductase
MGGALLRGWLASGFPAGRIFVREPFPSPEIADLLETHSIAQLPLSAPGILVLAVKPQAIDAVLAETAPLAGPGTVILSIAAGRRIASIASQVADGAAVVRAMPNLPAEIGRGMTAACANTATSESQRANCEVLLRAVGDVAWLPSEELMDAVTALSGSGPAYVFHLTECLTEAGSAAGLPESLAAHLARMTVAGAGELLGRSELSAGELRANVTSPHGTTAAALEVLMRKPGLKELLVEAVAAARRRSDELSR